MSQPLLGVKVLDLSWHVAGPYATRLLADYGADVLKVERPALGDPARSFGPFPKDEPHPERSGTFLHLNANKRSITANLKTEAGKEIIKELARWADLVVESFSPGVLSSLGLDYTVLSGINPSLVMCSISNFGQTGPHRDWKATDLTLYALAGSLLGMGESEREPLKNGEHLLEYQAGSIGAVAIMGALFHRGRGGQGQHVDISIHEVGSASADRRMTALLGYAYTGLSFTRQPIIGRALPSGAIPCEDGFVTVSVVPPARWTRFMEMIGRPDLIDDPDFRRPDAWTDPATKDRIDLLFYPWLADRTKQEIMEEAQAARIASGAIKNVVEVLEDPHLRERRFWQEGDHPMAGPLPYAGPSFRMEGDGWQLRSTAPLLGQHNEEVLLGQLGFSPQELAILREGGSI